MLFAAPGSSELSRVLPCDAAPEPWQSRNLSTASATVGAFSSSLSRLRTTTSHHAEPSRHAVRMAASAFRNQVQDRHSSREGDTGPDGLALETCWVHRCFALFSVRPLQARPVISFPPASATPEPASRIVAINPVCNLARSCSLQVVRRWSVAVSKQVCTKRQRTGASHWPDRSGCAVTAPRLGRPASVMVAQGSVCCRMTASSRASSRPARQDAGHHRAPSRHPALRIAVEPSGERLGAARRSASPASAGSPGAAAAGSSNRDRSGRRPWAARRPRGRAGPPRYAPAPSPTWQSPVTGAPDRRGALAPGISGSAKSPVNRRGTSGGTSLTAAGGPVLAPAPRVPSPDAGWFSR